MRKMHGGRMKRILLLGLGFLGPIATVAETPAFSARTYSIEFTQSPEPIVDALEKASKREGLQCYRSETAVPIQCEFATGKHGVLDLEEELNEHTVEIRAYADTPYPMDDRIDPAMERALLRSFELLSKKDILHIEQCLRTNHGNYQCRRLKFH